MKIKTTSFGVLISLLLIFLCWTAPLARADVAPDPQAAASSIAPGEGTQVQMLRERVMLDVQPIARGATNTTPVAGVTADFTLRNLGNADETMDVRFPKSFPINGGHSPAEFGNAIERMEVFVNGASVPNHTVHENGAPWAVWRVDFPAGRDVNVRVQYRTFGADYYGSVDFYYILETGAGWRGPIGEGDIIFQFPYAANFEMVEPRDASIAYSATTPPFVVDGNQLRWHFENLEPTPRDNVHLQMVRPDLWQAILDAREQVKRKPNDPAAQIKLGQAYRDAIPIKNWWLEDSEIADHLGWLADAAFRRATALAPNDASVHLAYARFLSDRAWSLTPEPFYSGARSELARALELDPNSSDAAHLAKQLDGLATIPEIAQQLAVTPTPIASPTRAVPTPLSSAPPKPTSVPDGPLQYELADDYCRQGQCLFTDASGNTVIGLATLEGYFTHVTRSAWGETKSCDSFLVTGGSKPLIDFLLALLKQGNTVNSKNELNQPIINLDLSGLSELEKQKLLASSAQQTISLRVLSFLPPKVGEVGACYSFVEILKVVGAHGEPAIPLQQLGFKGTTLWTKINNQNRSVFIAYPSNWYLDPKADASHILAQNVPPNSPAREGFAKFELWMDLNAKTNALQGERVTINGINWYRRVESGKTAQDRIGTFETVHDGLVYRIQTSLSGTGGKGPLFEYQATLLDWMVNSVLLEQ